MTSRLDISETGGMSNRSLEQPNLGNHTYVGNSGMYAESVSVGGQGAEGELRTPRDLPKANR